MIQSELINELAKSLAEFQKNITNPKKESDNPFFKSKYANLDGVLAHIRKPLTDVGLSIMQDVSGDDSGAFITTRIMHLSGQYIETSPLHLKPTKNDPQGIGSAITYGRRYQLMAVLNIAGTDDDDDGNSASINHNNQSPHAQVKKDSAPLCSEAQAKMIWNLCKDAGISLEDMKAQIMDKFKTNEPRKLTMKQASEFITVLNAAKEAVI